MSLPMSPVLILVLLAAELDVSAPLGLGRLPFRGLLNRWASPEQRLLNASIGRLLTLSGW